jgi:hypothetical protein
MKKSVLIASGVVLAGLVGGGLYLYSTLDDQTVEKAATVLDEFRASKQPDGSPQPGLPKQGVYRYTVTGNEKITRAGIDVERTFPTEAPALVRHRDGGFEFETRYSKEHTEMARYEIQPEGSYVTFAVTNLQVGPLSTKRERSWSPKLLRLPSESGRPTEPTWGGDFTAGDLKLSITNRYLPKETIDVGGTPVAVDVIESTQKITGEFTGDRTETFWYSPSLGLIVRYKIASSLKGPTNLDFNADQTLLSTEPQV